MEQILISAYTLDNLLNARREISVEMLLVLQVELIMLLASLKVLQKMSY